MRDNQKSIDFFVWFIALFSPESTMYSDIVDPDSDSLSAGDDSVIKKWNCMTKNKQINVKPPPYHHRVGSCYVVLCHA